MKLYGCQQVLLNKNKAILPVLEFICSEANKLTNCGIYLARQLYFKTNRYLGKYDLEKEYKSSSHYRSLYSQAAQQVLRSVYESFQSYRELKAAYVRGELENLPRLPKYRRKGYAVVSYPKQALRLIGKQIKIPLGKQVKAWFGINSFFILMPSNLNFAEIGELRILPRNKSFYAEFVYEKNVDASVVEKNNVLSIDPGLNNWLTCVSNVGTSFIVDGLHIKSMNRWYNKQLSTIKDRKPQGFWNNKLAAITEKRNRQIRDGINKAAKIVINHCLENYLGTVIFGWNKGNKTEIELGKKTNSEFVPIPTAKLKDRIAQLCGAYGIEFIETEESYTSKCSYLDNDFLPTYGSEKPAAWKPTGKRTKRGLYRTASNWYINADCNGASNIIRKVSTNSSSHRNIGLERVSRGILTCPQRIKLWSANKKTTLRNRLKPRCEASLLESAAL
ncbi:MAG: transposase [Hydrococcus sp. Prado102]|jgi:IS605 OrfB family transposase|nr:transposase [Hydrococcus sp. Prado102]